MVTLGVKASLSIVTASPSPINPIGEKLWYGYCNLAFTQ